jgi:outer membrane protein OmpA-like peptidoglycan-associated protein
MRVIASVCASSLLAGCIGHRPEPQRPMHLQRVILYQNGIGYFERAGHVHGETLELSFARGELDDVLKTLTVIDRLGAGVATVDVPTLGADDRTISLGVRMSAGRVHDVKVSYAVPTPTWKAAYRVVMDEDAKKNSLLQGWAMVNNASQEDWGHVQLTLATGAPMSFVHDLHTPQYVSRPDINGNLIAPTVIGPVGDEHARTADVDRDGILDEMDVCPDSTEDRDGLEDEDGCPDADNDRDRLLDAIDKCPNEPETYNGYEDTDGCPDRGRVVVTDSSIEVLDMIYFVKGAASIDRRSYPILDAIAATLKGNPTIRKIEVGGHASDDEGDAWSLASRRAAAVRQYLIDHGIESRRLAIVPYGASRPIDAKANEAGRSKNRRADFMIVQRDENAPERPSRRFPTKLDTRTMQASVHTASKPAAVAGTVRYVLSEPVTIKKGSSSMVSILNKPIGAEDVYLYRPDNNAPASDRHPFRAVRLVNDSGFMLEPGPIAIFARGTFVGDSMITRLGVGETAWIPYAVDGSTTVTATADNSERPVRIVSISRGVLTVENAGIHVTTYAIDAGQDTAKRIYIRHTKLAGYTTKELPPGTQDRGDSYLIPLPLQPSKSSSLTIEERQPRTQTIQILDAGATEIGLYVEGSRLPDGVAEKLKAAIELRKEMGKIEESLESLRDRLADIAPRADDIRENIKALEKVRNADDLRRRLVASLTQVTTESDAIAKKLGLESESLATARTKLQDALREINLDADR